MSAEEKYRQRIKEIDERNSAIVAQKNQLILDRVQAENEKAGVSSGILANAASAYAAQARRANKGVWFGSGKYDDACSTLGKLSTALQTLAEVEHKEGVSASVKAKALEDVRKLNDEYKQRAALYEQRKIKDGNLNPDGSLTNKILNSPKPYKRVNAIRAGKELSVEIDEYINRRTVELNNAKRDKTQLVRSGEFYYKKATVGMGGTFTGYAETDEHGMRTQKVFDKVYKDANQARCTLTDSLRSNQPIDIKVKRSAIAKIMINEMLVNENFRNGKELFPTVGSTLEYMPELGMEATNRRYENQIGLMVTDPAFRNMVDKMDDDRMLDFIADPSKLTDAYAKTPGRAKSLKDPKIQNTINAEKVKEKTVVKDVKPKSKGFS